MVFDNLPHPLKNPGAAPSFHTADFGQRKRGIWRPVTPYNPGGGGGPGVKFDQTVSNQNKIDDCSNQCKQKQSSGDSHNVKRSVATFNVTFTSISSDTH